MIKQGLHTKHAIKNQSATGCLLLLEEAVEKCLWENAFFFYSFTPRADQYLYIDCFNKGEVLTVDDCLEKFMKQYQQNNLPRNVLFEIADERKVTPLLQILQ